MKDEVASSSFASSGVPASLDTLPVEVFDLIYQLVGRAEHLALARVNYRSLELVAVRLYGSLEVDGKAAALLLTSRVRQTFSQPALRCREVFIQR